MRRLQRAADEKRRSRQQQAVRGVQFALRPIAANYYRVGRNASQAVRAGAAEEEREMSDYQPIYDAVRSKIGNGDIGAAIERAMRDANLSFYFDQAMQGWQQAAYEHGRPSVVYRPKLTQDGNKWCALMGENIQEGVSGFGDSPAESMYAFDVAWGAKIPSGLAGGK